MKYFRRFCMFIAGRLLVLLAVLGVLITVFYFSMNASNIYVILKDGMARRTQVIMMNSDAQSLTNYFSASYLDRDTMLREMDTAGSVYTNYYDITGIDHRLTLEQVWCWPWDETATAVFVESVRGIDGRLKSSVRTQAQEMGLDNAPPPWQTIRYDAVLVRENGRWIIRKMSQREVVQ